MFRLISNAAKAIRKLFEPLGHDYDHPVRIRFYDSTGNLVCEGSPPDVQLRYGTAHHYRELAADGSWLWHETE